MEANPNLLVQAPAGRASGQGQGGTSLAPIPSFAPIDPAPTQGTLGRFAGQPVFPGQLFVGQVVMWNPEVFPSNPEQWTRGLLVTLWSNGSLTSRPFGSNNGMDVTTEIVRTGGLSLVRFPFTIDGF